MKKLFLLLIVILAGALTGFLIIRNQDERQIRRNLSGLAKIVSKTGQENEVLELAGSQKIKKFFTPQCRIIIGEPFPDIEGEVMLVSTVYQARRAMNKVKISFHDLSIDIKEGRRSAITRMTAKATGPDPEGHGQIIEAREIEMEWVKISGAWKIDRVTLVEVLISD